MIIRLLLRLAPWLLVDEWLADATSKEVRS